MTFPIYGKSIQIMFQTTNQLYIGIISIIPYDIQHGVISPYLLVPWPYIPVSQLHSPPPMPPSQALHEGPPNRTRSPTWHRMGPCCHSENATADCWGKKNRPPRTGCVGWLVKHVMKPYKRQRYDIKSS